METKCKAERLGLQIGNIIFLLAGTKELICKNCSLQCPYTLKDFNKEFRKAKKETT